MCTKLQIARDGTITGEVEHPSCYGVGKATAARDFAAAHGIELSRSFFYTDSDEDLPLLDIVGRPRPINPDRALSAIAAKRGWPARRFTSRGTPQPREVVRTALAAASAVPSFLLGAAGGIADRRLAAGRQPGPQHLGRARHGARRRRPAGAGRAVPVVTPSGGVRLQPPERRRDAAALQAPAPRLRRHRQEGDPAQSALRPFFAAGGTIFVDRFNHEQAVHALEPAIEALRRGLSIVIAPEGTRSATPRLGKFKKGAFHLAMVAKRPIVPIVFRNTLDVLPKHGTVLRPATVEVVVHKPIATTGWTRRNLDRHVEEIHGLFEATLEGRKA